MEKVIALIIIGLIGMWVSVALIILGLEVLRALLIPGLWLLVLGASLSTFPRWRRMDAASKVYSVTSVGFLLLIGVLLTVGWH